MKFIAPVNPLHRDIFGNFSEWISVCFRTRCKKSILHESGKVSLLARVPQQLTHRLFIKWVTSISYRKRLQREEKNKKKWKRSWTIKLKVIDQWTHSTQVQSSSLVDWLKASLFSLSITRIHWVYQVKKKGTMMNVKDDLLRTERSY